ncbi:PD-(D/E)XK nuclease family protein [Marivirga sp.]|uniref:PD-(D/E)XK nuclease family protein n=1 Tax=Marivirga sp. TaxID=2018662 RepID=UPI003DA74632
MAEPHKFKITELEEFLNNNEIPSVKKQPKTFLEIARQPHYENVISNIYAFYFDPHEEYGLGHLFINSFIECIKEQMQQVENFLDDFQEFVIETEYGTEEKGRIDLFLYNDEQAILIENKIYHHLANNLDDYWNTATKEVKTKNIVGVLLTLGKQSGNLHQNFVNVLHLDFLKAVMSNIGNHLMEASEKYFTFLKDLYQNIENMSTKLLSSDDFKFYIENQDKILDTVKFNDQAKDHIKTQIVNAWDNQPNLEVKSATLNTKQFYKYREIQKEGVDKIYFSVYFDKLLAGQKEIWVNIFLTSEYMDFYNHSEILEIIRQYPSIEGYNKRNEKEGWVFLCGKTYNLNNDQITDLQNTVEGFIKNDKFAELFDELEIKLKTLNEQRQGVENSSIDELEN